jgi:hypothetical protein
VQNINKNMLLATCTHGEKTWEQPQAAHDRSKLLMRSEGHWVIQLARIIETRRGSRKEEQRAEENVLLNNPDSDVVVGLELLLIAYFI